jgi:uncharacterized protein YceK
MTIKSFGIERMSDMKKGKMRRMLGILLICTVVLSACSTAASETTPTAEVTEATANTASTAGSQSETVTAALPANVKVSDVATFDEEDHATDWNADSATVIKLNGTSAAITGSGAATANGSVNITEAGTYVLNGTLSDGQVVVNVQDEGVVHLVLNGVEIHDNDSAAIDIKEADKVVMTLQEGTVNSISDGKDYVFADAATDEPSAALFSKADLTINGTGKLSVVASYNDGITSKDDLKIVSGTIAIQAADDGIVGKDMIAIENGDLTIKAEGDGIKSTNDADAALGFIAIAGGTFQIEAGNDGIQAETALIMDGGTYTLMTGGGSSNGEVKQEEMGGGSPRGAASTTTATEETASTKGLKAGGDIAVNSGSFAIDSADDAVHSNNNVTVIGGDMEIATGDDGIHACLGDDSRRKH